MRVDVLITAVILWIVSESTLGSTVSLSSSVDGRGERPMTVMFLAMVVVMMVMLFGRLHYCLSVWFYSKFLPLKTSDCNGYCAVGVKDLHGESVRRTNRQSAFQCLCPSISNEFRMQSSHMRN